MLVLSLPALDDDPAVEVHLEHSLVSLSKWESIYKKPFFAKTPHAPEEFIAYAEAMLVDPPHVPNMLARLSIADMQQVQEYLNNSQTATTFREDPNQPPSKEVVTSELIYYWLVALNIDFYPTETWHLSRLMTLVRICGIKQSKPKKMTRQQQMAEYKRLNEQRRRESGSSG